jgi:hypothetical protein
MNAATKNAAALILKLLFHKISILPNDNYYGECSKGKGSGPLQNRWFLIEIIELNGTYILVLFSFSGIPYLYGCYYSSIIMPLLK